MARAFAGQVQQQLAAAKVRYAIEALKGYLAGTARWTHTGRSQPARAR